MRVLHVINGLATGGAETVLYRLTTYPSDVEHEIVCLESRASYSAPLEAHGIRVHHLDWVSPLSSVQGFARLHRLIKESGADVVQAWMYRSNLLAGVAARLAGIPVIWNIRSSTLDPLRLATRMLARLGGRLTPLIPAAVINCSSRSAEVHARYGYSLAKTTIISNGYDPQEFRPDERPRQRVRKKLGAAPEDFLIGTIARWHPQKGYPMLLQALGLLRDRGIPVNAVLVGRELDEQNGTLTRLLTELDLTEHVQLLGERAEVVEIGRALDLHILGSVGSEGFPNVVAETMLSGTPNVATDVGETSLIVGSDGWIVPPSDPVQLADGVERAYQEWKASPAHWQKRREAGRARLARDFSVGRMVAAYNEVWRRVASERLSKESRPAATSQPAPATITASARPEAAAREQPRLRILHVINNLGLGGAETLLFRLLSRDATRDHVIVSLGKSGWYSERLQEAGFKVHHLDMESPPSVARGVLRLNQIIRQSDADIVQCWMYRSNVLAGGLARAAGKRVVWGIHSSSFKHGRPSARALVHLSGFLAKWYPDFIINCSSRSAELHASLGYSAVPGTVVHNGYDPAEFYADEAAARAARKTLGLKRQDFAVGSISRWDILKDIPNLIAAARLVRQHGLPIRIFMIGAGLSSSNAQLMREIERAGCTDFITPLGPRSDVQNLARALNLHVLASVTEAFPNVVAETMLCETPNVVTDVGDAALMVGNSGWVVPPSDPRRLADAIVEAYHEWKEAPDEWAERRKSARAQIAENFSFDRMATGYESVWREVLAARP